MFFTEEFMIFIMKEQLFHIIIQDYIIVQDQCLFQGIVQHHLRQSHNLVQGLVKITDLMEINTVEEDDKLLFLFL